MQSKECYFEFVVDIDPNSLESAAKLIDERILILGVTPTTRKDARCKLGYKIVKLNLVLGCFAESVIVPLLRSGLVTVKGTRIRGILEPGWLADLQSISSCLRVLYNAALEQICGSDMHVTMFEVKHDR